MQKRFLGLCKTIISWSSKQKLHIAQLRKTHTKTVFGYMPINLYFLLVFKIIK